MIVIADTNLILRVLTQDDPDQYALAARALSSANSVIFSIVVLCETVWTLTRQSRWGRPEIAKALRTLLDDPRVIVDRHLAERGLAILEAGGDFADGVIAADGQRQGNGSFTTFDKEAARLLEAQGTPVTLLG